LKCRVIFVEFQANLDRLSFAPLRFSRDEILSRVHGALRKKHRDLAKALTDGSQGIRDLMQQTPRRIDLRPKFCCDLDVHDMHGSLDPLLNTEVLFNASCSPSRDPEPFHDLTPIFERIGSAVPAARWQFFISQLTHIEYPAQAGSFCGDVTRHRVSYTRGVRPRSKLVVVIVDHGGYLGQTQLDVGKAVTRFFIQNMSPQDRIAVIAMAHEATLAPGCHNLVYARDETIHRMLDFVDGIKLEGNTTNHKSALSMAFDLLWKTPSSEDEYNDALIALISMGKFSHLNDKKNILDLVMLRRRELKRHRVVINTYMLGDPRRRIVFARDFLEAIAATPIDLTGTLRGKAFVVNSTDVLISTAGRFVEAFPPPDLFPPMNYSSPWFDPISRQLLVTVALPVKLMGMNRAVPDGVLGFDVPLHYLVEDLQMPEQSPEHYAFLLNAETGHVMSHPMFVPSKAVAVEGAPPIVSSLEPELPPLRIFRWSRVDLFNEENSVQYSWKNVEGTPFSVFVANRTTGRHVLALESPISSKEIAGRPLVYHRLDLSPQAPKCLHSGQLSSTQATGIFLSAVAFASPFTQQSTEETKESVHELSRYLFDLSNLMTNPGMVKAHVKEEVRLLAYLTKDWNINTSLDFVIRRYITSAKGVMMMWPATIIPQKFDPTMREWYAHAAELRDRVVLTGPYLDAAGYGQVITLSRALIRDGSVIAVIGMDLNVGYLGKLIGDLFSECDARSSTWGDTTCFIIDHKGYVVSHPSLVDATPLQPSWQTPMEELHIAHKEPVIANEILSLKNFSKKSACISPSDRTVQRTYELRMSLSNALLNAIQGDLPCHRFHLSAVPRSNVFIGLVNRTCEGGHAFMPCGVNDRGCLNCRRMAQDDPECPCECAWSRTTNGAGQCTSFGSGDGGSTPDRSLDLCAPTLRSHEVLLPTLFSLVGSPSVPPKCFTEHCTIRPSASECYESSACGWCVSNLARVPLEHPFCAVHTHCHRGLVNGPSPYDTFMASLQDQLNMYSGSEYTSDLGFGPILVVVPALLILALVAKFAVCSGSAGSYTAAREQHVPLFVPSEQEVEQLGCGGSQQGQLGAQANLLLNSFNGNEANVLSSPYRYASNNYRQRPTGDDSDLGYSSTITPSSEMAPGTAARRAVSPESGRASSPSICSSTRLGPQKKKNIGGAIAPLTVITTTAQIHSSDEASDLECFRDQCEGDRTTGGVSTKIDPKELKDVAVIRKTDRNATDFVRVKVDSTDACHNGDKSDLHSSNHRQDHADQKTNQFQQLRHKPNELLGADSIEIKTKPNIVTSTSELIEILERISVAEETC
ncbi:VWFA and cache domain-containing protein 1-like, partial [Tropilaelaps mercedesae]